VIVEGKSGFGRIRKSAPVKPIIANPFTTVSGTTHQIEIINAAAPPRTTKGAVILRLIGSGGGGFGLKNQTEAATSIAPKIVRAVDNQFAIFSTGPHGSVNSETIPYPMKATPIHPRKFVAIRSLAA
jgi:hypothetical protein